MSSKGLENYTNPHFLRTLPLTTLNKIAKGDVSEKVIEVGLKKKIKDRMQQILSKSSYNEKKEDLVNTIILHQEEQTGKEFIEKYPIGTRVTINDNNKEKSGVILDYDFTTSYNKQALVGEYSNTNWFDTELVPISKVQEKSGTVDAYNSSFKEDDEIDLVADGGKRIQGKINNIIADGRYAYGTWDQSLRDVISYHFCADLKQLDEAKVRSNNRKVTVEHQGKKNLTVFMNGKCAISYKGATSNGATSEIYYNLDGHESNIQIKERPTTLGDSRADTLGHTLAGELTEMGEYLQKGAKEEDIQSMIEECIEYFQE